MLMNWMGGRREKEDSKTTLKFLAWSAECHSPRLKSFGAKERYLGLKATKQFSLVIFKLKVLLDFQNRKVEKKFDDSDLVFFMEVQQK